MEFNDVEILKQAARNFFRALESDDIVDIDDERSKLCNIAFMWAQQEAIDKVDQKKLKVDQQKRKAGL